MSPTLRDALLGSGAVVNGASALPLHFGAPKAELHAALELCVLVDRSTSARLLATGPDFLDLLNRLSTGAVAALPPGRGRATVLTTPKGRIVERLYVHQLGADGVLAVGGPEAGPRILEHLKRYTFSEDTGVSEVTAKTAQLALIGPLAGDALQTAGFERPRPCDVITASFEGRPIHVLGHDGLSPDGFSLVVAAAYAGSLWKTLMLAVSRMDGRPAGQQAVEAARILRGVPAPGLELNEEHNPLEAGLWDAVAFDKGCYVGQEVVARLNTYDKVSRRLVGVELPAGVAAPSPGTGLYHDEREIGSVSSSTLPPGAERAVALAYVKRKAFQDGLRVGVGDRAGTPAARLVPLPFASGRSDDV